MKIKEGLIVRKMDDSYVAVAVGEMTNNFNGLIRLNDSAYFVFNLLKEDISYENLVDKMLEEYDVTKEKASHDLDEMLAIFRENELLDE